MVTRGMGHFSLVAAAPLPLLVLVLRRATAREHVSAHWKDAVLIGALVWWSASTDVYYAVYAILIGGLYIAGKVVSLRRRHAGGTSNTEIKRTSRISLPLLT